MWAYAASSTGTASVALQELQLSGYISRCLGKASCFVQADTGEWPDMMRAPHLVQFEGLFCIGGCSVPESETVSRDRNGVMHCDQNAAP